MEHKAVTLMIRYRGADGKWRRSPAARGGNGRVKPGHALVDKKAVPVMGGNYELRMYENRRLIYVNASKNAATADAHRTRLEVTRSAKAVAKDAGLVVSEAPSRKTLKATAAAYIKDAEDRGAQEAAEQARNVATEFMDVVRKGKRVYVDEVTRDDIFAFHAALRKRGCKDRTVANKHQRLTSWLRFAGIDKGIDKRIDKDGVLPPVPRYSEELPTIYSSEKTGALLAAADDYMRVCILLGLKCGMRDGELKHLEFSDVNRTDKTLRVQNKPRWGWKVKTWEERDIPVPDDVLSVLREWEGGRKEQTLVLGTRNCKPNTKLLRKLKQLVRDAGLNCGRCDGCRERKECEDFTLHKLRRTYITTLLRQGIDLRTVQAYAGHKDLASTMRYLTPATGVEAQAKLNAVKW